MAQSQKPEEDGIQWCPECENEVDGHTCMFCGNQRLQVIKRAQSPKPKAVPEHEGFLYKQGGVKKNWRKRYFALNSQGLLSYHKTDQLHIRQFDETQGSINIVESIIETFELGYHQDRDGYVMGIQEKGNPRQYLLEADSYRTRKNWLKCFGKFGAQFNKHNEKKRRQDSSLIEGFMWKKGGWRRNWTRRYFILLREPPVISYMEGKDAAKAKGNIDITKSTTVITENHRGFLLRVKPKKDAERVFLLKAVDERQRQQWIRAIELLVRHMNGGSGDLFALARQESSPRMQLQDSRPSSPQVEVQSPKVEPQELRLEHKDEEREPMEKKIAES